MSDPLHTSTHASGSVPEPVAPDTATSARSVADELFAHGLLTYLNTDTPQSQDARVRRVMAVLESGGAAASSGRNFRFPIRSARGWLTLAACLTIGTVAVFLGVPGEQSAQAVVQQSIDAMRSTSGGDRRYEIRLTRRAEDAIPSLPGAIIDTRSPNLMVLRANAPDGHEIIAGRDATGDWAIRLDGGIERTHPEVAWPRWAKVGDESLFVDSVDRLLEELTKSYDLQKEGTATIEGKGTASYRHIVGTKKRHPSPGGDRVEVWIDPASKTVERLEMRWELPAQNDAAQPEGRDRGGDEGPGPEGDRGPRGQRDPMRQRPPRGEGPEFRRGPHPDDRDGPDGRDGMDDRDRGPRDGDRPFPPRGGPDGRRPGDGADQRPGPGGPDNRGPEDRRPDGPGPEGQGPEGRRPHGPGPDGGPEAQGGEDRDPMRRPGGPLAGPHPRPDPRPEGGPPPRADGPRGPGPGLRPMPPKLLIMQRVDVPTLENGWFSPEAHLSSKQP